jgi:hypothetical protein
VFEEQGDLVILPGLHALAEGDERDPGLLDVLTVRFARLWRWCGTDRDGPARLQGDVAADGDRGGRGARCRQQSVRLPTLVHDPHPEGSGRSGRVPPDPPDPDGMTIIASRTTIGPPDSAPLTAGAS